MGEPRQQEPSSDRDPAVPDELDDLIGRARAELASLSYDARAVNPGRSFGEAEVISLAHYLQVRQALGSAEAAARLLGRPVDGRLLRDAATVSSRLFEHYAPEVIPDWLQGESPDLGGRRPIDLIREGRIVEVLAALEAQVSGSFA